MDRVLEPGEPWYPKASAGGYTAAMRWLWTSLILMIGAGALTGCTGQRGATEWDVPAGRYTSHFQAAREAVRDLQFELAIIDARSGEIVTAPASSSGLASPWRLHGISTARNSLESMLHRERRRVQVVFEPVVEGDTEVRDLRLFNGDVTGRVIVTVDRVYRDGRQVDSTSIQDTSFYRDPRLLWEREARSVDPEIRRDDALGAAIVARIEALISAGLPEVGGSAGR